MSAKLLQAIAVAQEVTGTPVSSDAALEVMVRDLSAFPEPQVLASLRRCMREVKGKLTLADIVSRLDDGRPTPEVAWSMVPKDEAASVCWTLEMRDAYKVAYPLVASGELVQARMAFLEAYRSEVQRARDARHPAEWQLSLGTDKDARELVVLDAAEKGRISVEAAKRVLPHHREDEGISGRLLAIAGRALKQLEDKAA
jgi:hypothetical protein